MLLGAIKTVKHTIKQTKENITKVEEWWKKRTANKVQDNFQESSRELKMDSVTPNVGFVAKEEGENPLNHDRLVSMEDENADQHALDMVTAGG